LGMVHKRGEMAFIRLERRGTMRQGLRKQVSRSRRHDPVLLSLPEQQVLKRDRFDALLTVPQPEPVSSPNCLHLIRKDACKSEPRPGLAKEGGSASIPRSARQKSQRAG
jgi:hypothetical protein